MDKSGVIVIGKTGQVASAFQALCSAPAAAVSAQAALTPRFVARDELDLSRPDSIADFFRGTRPQVILNLAAYTQVDKAESEKELCYAVNASASEALARACENYVYISTDYVYGVRGGGSSVSPAALGHVADASIRSPLKETDPVAPVNFYGESKLAGERLAQAANPNTFIVRTSWVYGETGVNFPKRIVELARTRPELKVIHDQIGSPTWAPDLAEALCILVQRLLAQNDVAKSVGAVEPTLKVLPGVYNYSNEGSCSWYEFACAAIKAAGLETPVLPIKTEEYPTPAKRPHYSVLDKTKIKAALNIEIPDWQESFARASTVLFKG